MAVVNLLPSDALSVAADLAQVGATTAGMIRAGLGQQESGKAVRVPVERQQEYVQAIQRVSSSIMVKAMTVINTALALPAAAWGADRRVLMAMLDRVADDVVELMAAYQAVRLYCRPEIIAAVDDVTTMVAEISQRIPTARQDRARAKELALFDEAQNAWGDANSRLTAVAREWPRRRWPWHDWRWPWRRRVYVHPVPPDALVLIEQTKIRRAEARLDGGPSSRPGAAEATASRKVAGLM